MRRRAHYFELADDSPGRRRSDGNIREIEKMHDRSVKGGYSDHYPVSGIKFLRDRANSSNRVHCSIVVGTVVIGDHNVSSRQAGNCPPRNGCIDDAGTIPVVDCPTRGYLPNA